jgi:asparagine synthase (glutamine-hydrolysing)
MCGIAGAVGILSPEALDGAPVRNALASCVERISAAQSHRGPDGSGRWAADSGEVVFGHRRLAIIDLSEAGAQPMIDPANASWNRSACNSIRPQTRR